MHWASPYWPNLAPWEVYFRSLDQLASMADAEGGRRCCSTFGVEAEPISTMACRGSLSEGLFANNS